MAENSKIEYLPCALTPLLPALPRFVTSMVTSLLMRLPGGRGIILPRVCSTQASRNHSMSSGRRRRHAQLSPIHR